MNVVVGLGVGGGGIIGFMSFFPAQLRRCRDEKENRTLILNTVVYCELLLYAMVCY